MTKRTLAWTTTTLLAAACAPAIAQGVGGCSPPGWVMTFDDEFNGFNLDTTKWRAENAALIKNNELQYYAPANVVVNNGVMSLISRRQNMGGRQYTSGLVETRGKFSQTFGRFEYRAKMPKTRGLWPAFWMLPENGQWPPEIDIMELLGHDPFTVYMSNHWGVWPNVPYQTTAFTGPDFSADFHTFRVDWFPDRMEFYVDETLRAIHTQAVPAQPFYMIINTAVGGNWPGNPDATTVFPQSHVVDWVRAYRRDGGLNRLANGGFETQASGNRPANWTFSGAAYAEPFSPRSAADAGKLFGRFTGAANTSTMHQEFAAAPGERWRATAYWMNNSADRMQGANFASTIVEFRTAAGALISSVSDRSLDANSPLNEWQRVVVTGVAPAGTARVRIVLQFSQPAMAAGAAFMDDVELVPVEFCPADVDRSGFVDSDDFIVYVDAFGGGETCADFDESGFTDSDDFIAFVTAFSNGC